MVKHIDMMGAIELAMDAEEKARRFYEDGGQKTEHPLGRELFRQLAAFEANHYLQLKRLLDSLKASGRFIAYQGTSCTKTGADTPAASGDEPNKDQLLDILNTAIRSEEEAQKRYADLARSTNDVSGRDMFLKLSEEEKVHARILNDEFYNLSNAGAWSSKSLWSE